MQPVFADNTRLRGPQVQAKKSNSIFPSNSTIRHVVFCLLSSSMRSTPLVCFLQTSLTWTTARDMTVRPLLCAVRDSYWAPAIDELTTLHLNYAKNSCMKTSGRDIRTLSSNLQCNLSCRTFTHARIANSYLLNLLALSRRLWYPKHKQQDLLASNGQ